MILTVNIILHLVISKWLESVHLEMLWTLVMTFLISAGCFQLQFMLILGYLLMCQCVTAKMINIIAWPVACSNTFFQMQKWTFCRRGRGSCNVCPLFPPPSAYGPGLSHWTQRSTSAHWVQVMTISAFIITVQASLLNIQHHHLNKLHHNRATTNRT